MRTLGVQHVSSQEGIPVERRMQDPKGTIVGASPLVVGADFHRRAEHAEHLGENVACLVHCVARELFVRVALKRGVSRMQTRRKRYCFVATMYFTRNMHFKEVAKIRYMCFT